MGVTTPSSIRSREAIQSSSSNTLSYETQTPSGIIVEWAFCFWFVWCILRPMYVCDRLCMLAWKFLSIKDGVTMYVTVDYYCIKFGTFDPISSVNICKLMHLCIIRVNLCKTRKNGGFLHSQPHIGRGGSWSNVCLVLTAESEDRFLKRMTWLTVRQACDSHLS